MEIAVFEMTYSPEEKCFERQALVATFRTTKSTVPIELGPYKKYGYQVVAKGFQPEITMELAGSWYAYKGCLNTFFRRPLETEGEWEAVDLVSVPAKVREVVEAYQGKPCV